MKIPKTFTFGKKKYDHSHKDVIEEEVHEPIFYVHENPEPVIYGEVIMPMKIEEPDSATPGQLLVEDGQGGQRPLTPQEIAVLQKRVPDGINVPGYVKPGQPRQQKHPGQQPQQPQQRKVAPNAQPQPIIHPPQQQHYYQQQYTNPPQQPYPQQPYPQQPYMQQPYPQQPIPIQEPPKLVPPTEMALVDGAYHIFVDLAGVDKSTLNMVYEDGVVRITGNRESAIETLKKQLKPKKAGRLKNPILRSSCTVPNFLLGKFTYEYTIQKVIDDSAITAEYINGVLHVTLPHRTKGDKVNISLSM